MDNYDICVIGGGPSGYAAAMRAIDFGLRVVLVEAERVGGAGIYNGALSSKALWELSQKVYAVNETIVSMGRKKFELTWEEVIKTKNEAIFERKVQYSAHLTLLQNEALSKLFTYERGFGEFISRNEVKITKTRNNSKGKSSEEKVIFAKNIIIATGSKPRKLPNMDVDEEFILTSDGIHHVADYPKSLVIVGAGVIGCEYATIFSNFGKTKVHIIDRADRILPFEDADLAELVEANMEAKGVVVHHKAKLERLEKVENGVEYTLSYPDGRTETIQVERALLAIGRIPNVSHLGLENIGVELTDRGHILDVDTRTSVSNIYAVGDASGHIALVNMGEMEGRHAVEKIFNPEVPPLHYGNVCTIMFLQPEVAAVGLNEQSCRADNIPIRVVKIHYSTIARAIAMRNTEGFFKIIVTNDDEMKILGMRAIGPHASSAIQAVALLIKMNKGIEELAEMIHPHPSIIEGIQEGLRMLLNKSVFKSSVFKDRLQCFSVVDGVETPLQRL